MKIGITERGDASIDYGWEEKLDMVDGAVLITKNITDYFISRILPLKEKVILHATITGFGGSILEPKADRCAACKPFQTLGKDALLPYSGRSAVNGSRHKLRFLEPANKYITERREAAFPLTTEVTSIHAANE